jgi:hypothetical protein
MRIDREYGKRSEEDSLEPKIKYFIACEGRKTEYLYFSGINKNRVPLKINSLTEFVFLRHEKDKGNNPLSLYEEAGKELDSYDNYFPDTGDQFCLIVDRDKHSFSENQYDSLLELERQEKVKLYVTNPCFEFWLLLHFKDCKEYDSQKLPENSGTGNRTYVESVLKECPGGSYSKTGLKFDDNYKDKVHTAINNSKKYTTEVNELKNSLGTNAGVLIESMTE